MTGKTFSYFKNRIRYEFDTIDFDRKPIRAIVSQLTEMTTLEYTLVKDVKILEVIDFSSPGSPEDFALYIENELTDADTAWMKKPPLQRIKFKGETCDFEIFIHAKSSRTEALIKKMKELEASRDGQIDKNSEMFKLIHSIKGLKVVVLVPPCLC